MVREIDVTLTNFC